MHLSSRLLAASFLIGSLVAGPLAASPALAEETSDPLIAVLPPASIVPGASTPVVDGSFDMVVEVTGGVLEDLVLAPSLPSWWISHPQAPAKTVPAGSCPDACRVSWRIDPAAQGAPWYDGLGHLDVAAALGDRSIQTYGSAVDYRPVVRATWASRLLGDATENTVAGTSVFDTGGEVRFAGIAGRGATEKVQLAVISNGADLSAKRLITVDAAWGSETDEFGYAQGRGRLETSDLPEGFYRVIAQAHDGAGHWSFATPTTLAVVHSPLIQAEPSSGGLVAAGRETTIGVTVRGLRDPYVDPGTVRLMVGGMQHDFPADSMTWYRPAGPGQPSSRWVSLPTVGLPVGRAVVGVEVFDTSGATMGTASTSIEVLDFNETVTLPTFIVGKSRSVRLRATAPAGTSMTQCYVGFKSPLASSPIWNLCSQSGTTSVDASQPMVPSRAGTGMLGLTIDLANGVPGPVREYPVTVYAKRTASLTVPRRATWGTTQTAKVKVLDEKELGVQSAAGSGIPVTLQRKKAGTSIWVTIATGTTGSTGVAAIRYSQRATGRLRALVKGTVPGSTARTPERATTSVAKVTWSSLPTSARAGSLVTAAVYAKPYEKGAIIRFQARKLGSTTWTTYGSGTVATSGYAKAYARLWSRGTWEVRIQRVGTTLQATGYSTVRRISIT